MPATIADVAHLSGVSIKQVSRVINHEDRVAESTRAKVRWAIQELSYVPNVWAQRLARGYSRLIGLCIYNATSSYIMEILNAMMDVADRLGYRVTIYRFNPRDAARVQEMLTWASQRHIDGMILTPPIDNSQELVKGLQALQFPFVQLSPHSRNDGCAWVSANDEGGGFEATRHLIKLGHRRIAFIQGDPDHGASWDRLHGYQRALAEYGIEAAPKLIRCGDWSFETGLNCATELLTLLPCPTAIVCTGDEMAAGALHAIAKAGLRCPQDISVTGYNDVDLARQIWPPLTTIKQPVYQLATEATTRLIEKMIAGDPDRSGTEIPIELVERNSTGPVPAQKSS